MHSPQYRACCATFFSQHYEAFKRRVHGGNTLRSQADREEALGALRCAVVMLSCAVCSLRLGCQS